MAGAVNAHILAHTSMNVLLVMKVFLSSLNKSKQNLEGQVKDYILEA